MDVIAERANQLAGRLAEAAARTQSGRERSEMAQMARLMTDAPGKAFTLALADRVFRSSTPKRQSARLHELIDRFGVPRFLPAHQRWMLAAGKLASGLAPAPAMAAMRQQMQRSSSRVILDGADRPLTKYLTRRRIAGTRVNLNHLGEAVLGEAEAAHRLAKVLEHLRHPQVNYVSVKISALFSQINVLDFDHTVDIIKQRVRSLYRAALPGGKFVNLDMEEYRDLALTVAAFQQVLDEPEFTAAAAGIVLQAYLPDSWGVQQALTVWARRRVAIGGTPIKLRLVKGANLAMEAVDAELNGWTAAPYADKAQTDANYRRMLEYGCRRENAAVVRLGVASHNLFDVALALVLREDFGTADCVEFEMLEGMANHQARAVQKEAGGLLVYAPAAAHTDFLNALAYLVRRLDENTAPQNFLHDLFDLRPGSEAWQRQQERFTAGWASRTVVSAQSRRHRDPCVEPDAAFTNAPNTDWTRPDQREALRRSLAEWRYPAMPPPGRLDDVLDSAVVAQKGWAGLGTAARAAVLRRAAAIMERMRFDPMAQMMHEAQKAAGEADVETSEAIDFACYAALTASPAAGVDAVALGVVMVAPPWNFPYAIPCGGVTAALAMGNSVILKPAPETPGVAWHLACHLWEAGVPRDVLHFFPCADDDIGRALVTDRRVNAVVLTGAYQTARLFLSWRPSLRLYAETSGKNGLVITAQADRDLAIKDLVRSAFGHAGQKCSAASLAILEAEVYDDPQFLRALRDAASSLRVGPATDLGSVVTPLIREPSPQLRRALTALEPGEAWLLEPKCDPQNPCLWSPGVKIGVRQGSWFHQNECFGPVLGLMRAHDLADAIRFQNDTPFGLTGGIHSLCEAEVAVWKQQVQVGNAYVNRPITGAVVRRQPFGGWKRSSFGSAGKAGGPHYTAAFSTFSDSLGTQPTYQFRSYQSWWDNYVSLEHDPSGLQCEVNLLRYRPCRGVLLRLDQSDAEALALAGEAADVCGVALFVSFTDSESDSDLIARLPLLAPQADTLRTLRVPADALLTAAYEAGLRWINDVPLRDGRIELPRWMREQSISETRHRYGLIECPATQAGKVVQR